RQSHTTVWTGSEMIIWGGSDGSNDFNTGGRYNPSTDSWTPTSTVNAPDGRLGHTAVWTGSEMIVWGGVHCCRVFKFNTGGRYNPISDSWKATATAGAPEKRTAHTAVWTDSEMVVWGGANSDGELNDGGRYDPKTDSWTATSTSSAPAARDSHTAVWTGSEMIVWGGYGMNNLRTGGRYNPTADSWVATTTTDPRDGRVGFTSVWTGNEMT